MTHAKPTARLVVAVAPTRSKRRGLAVFARPRRAITMAAAVAVVAIAGVTGMLAAGASDHGSALSPGVANAQVVTLADHVAAIPLTGNATLVVHRNVVQGETPFTGADLYLDNGAYYYAETPAGLPAAVKSNPQDYTLKPIIDAMAHVSSGNPQAARAAFLKAADPEYGGDIQHAPTWQQDNVVWVSAIDVLGAAYGRPAVLAGTLRALATVHGVSVTRGHYNGVRTLEISMFVPRVVATVADQQAMFDSKIHAGGLTEAQKRELQAQRSKIVHKVTTPAHYMRLTVNGHTGGVMRYTDIGLVVSYHVSRVDTAQFGGTMSTRHRHVAIDSDGLLIERSLRYPELFGELFDRHWEVVHRYCRSRAGSDGEGLAAETFRFAFDRRALYDTCRDDARPWLLGVATNLIRNHLRSQGRGDRAVGRLEAGPTADHADAAIDRAEAALLGPALTAALDGIPTGDRDALLLMAWNDLSYDEVAAALEIPVGTVRSRISRARLRLRARLAELGYAQEVGSES